MSNVPECLNVVCSVCSSREIRQVKLDLVPSFVESHWHCADERLDTSGRLVVGSSESSTNTLVVENLDLECEVFLQL